MINFKNGRLTRLRLPQVVRFRKRIVFMLGACPGLGEHVYRVSAYGRGMRGHALYFTTRPVRRNWRTYDSRTGRYQ